MGRLMHDPSIAHFSHPHPLELSSNNNLQSLSPSPPCSACNLHSSGWIYSCKPCNFTLHLSCTQLPSLITHPAHKIHPLTLLSTPAYPGGVFKCDGCSHKGHRFNYHCNDCGFDIHTTCAQNPLSVSIQSHPHIVELAFHSPYLTKGFSCDICQKIGANHWLYRCGLCEFDAHMECAMSQDRGPAQAHVLQNHNSFPGANRYQQQYGNGVNPAAGGGQRTYMQSQRMGTNMQGGYQVQQPPPIRYNNNNANNAIMDTMVQGFVDGAAQQIGQSYVQNVFGGGSGGGGGGGYDDSGGLDLGNYESAN